MKSQALKTAWILFRKYQMTFSQALIEGWKKVKRDLLRIEFASTSSEEITYRQRLANRFNELKETFYVVRQEVQVERQKAHELSQNNDYFFINKHGYQKWMQ